MSAEAGAPPLRPGALLSRRVVAPPQRAGGVAAEVARPRLPALLWVVLAATFVACVAGDVSVLTFNLKGWMWLLPAALALVEALSRRAPHPFPLALWLPWAAVLLVSLLVSPFPNALQRTAMMLAPLLVGFACSGLPLGAAGAGELLRRLRQFAWALLAVALVQLGVLTSFELPGATSLAPQAMTGALLSVYFAAGYAADLRGSLAAWAAMAFFPVLAMTRTAAVATAMTLPATFARLPLARRAALALVVALGGVALFQTERVQHKMFYSGAGRLQDLTPDNPDLRSSGRFALWEAMHAQIARKPLFGHGANAQEDFILRTVGFKGQPHNDWLRVAFDYGWSGVGLYAATLVAQALLLLRRLRRAHRVQPRSSGCRVLLAGGAGSFVVYALIMVTDNILLYASYFGMLQFALIGAAYAVDDAEGREAAENAGDAGDAGDAGNAGHAGDAGHAVRAADAETAGACKTAGATGATGAMGAEAAGASAGAGDGARGARAGRGARRARGVGPA